MTTTTTYRQVRRNFVIGVLDGGFFGLGLGLASFVSVVPLFIDSLTDSAVLIGLISATHLVGWQLPQILTANRVSRLWRYKPMVLLMTLNERVPFLLLALVAWQVERLGNGLALALAFILLTWRGLGGGLTGTAWQSMIAKIIPTHRRGTFYGTQSAVGSLLASGGAVVAGAILHRLDSPQDFALCFLLAFGAVSISYSFLAQIDEQSLPPQTEAQSSTAFWQGIRQIIRTDANYRLYLVGRILAQVGWMASTFFTIYAVRTHDMNEATAGVMTSLLLIVQMMAAPVLGWVGDRWGHRELLGFGALSMMTASLLAMSAPSLDWFYLVFALTGFSNVTLWGVALAITVQFGTEVQRPAYIGLTNSTIGLATLVAPMVGGLLADLAGYEATFALAATGAAMSAFVMHFLMVDPASQSSHQ